MFYRLDILNRKEEILNWISENQSKAFICKMLSCRPDTLNVYLKKMDIKYDGNKGLKGIKCGIKTPIKDYLNNKKFINSHRLKNKLIEEGYKEKKCERCNLEKWNEEDIPLELHHKDGNKDNNNLENLEILCPNCHALEPNNSGASNKKMPS